MFSQRSTVNALACMLSPSPVPHPPPLTSCLLPFADLGLHYFPCLQPLPELEGYSSFGGVWNSMVAQSAKSLPAVQETQDQSLGQEDPLEKEMATHSSILPWKILWIEEPGGLQSMGSQESDIDLGTKPF